MIINQGQPRGQSVGFVGAVSPLGDSDSVSDSFNLGSPHSQQRRDVWAERRREHRERRRQQAPPPPLNFEEEEARPAVVS